MNQTTTQPLTTLELKTSTRASTNIPFFSDLPPLETPTIPTFTELLAEYQATVSKPQVVWNDRSFDQLADPFAIYETNLAEASPQPVSWLWRKRLSLSGITLLDGDHGCGKSLLALHMAACVSSGSCLPDGTSTLQGGVVIVTPNSDATTTQLQLLTALGANLSCIEILSYIQDPEKSSHPSGYRPFSLPEDFPRLFEAVERVNARLIIFDPFIDLLSDAHRWTDQRLGSLLADLKLHLIERNVACLLIRNCTVRGGHARPSMLERSDHFETIATSRLMLTPNPINPSHLLLAHAKSAQTALTPTLILQIQSRSDDPKIASITFQGSHCLTARDFLTHRPEGLHRRLLSQHLLKLIVGTTDPIPIASLYASSPHSSPFQIQRALADLLNMGQIERPTRSFYAPAPATPIPSFKTTAARNPSGEQTQELKTTAARNPSGEQTQELKSTAARSSSDKQTQELKATAARSPSDKQTQELKATAARSSSGEQTQELKTTAARNPSGEQTQELKTTATRNPSGEQTQELKTTATRNPSGEQTQELKATATRNPSGEQTQELKATAARSSSDKRSQELKATAARSPSDKRSQELKSTAARSSSGEQTQELKITAVRNPSGEQTQELKTTATRNPSGEQTQELKTTATRNPSGEQTQELKATAARNPSEEQTQELKATAATSLSEEQTQELKATAARSPIVRPASSLKTFAPKRPHKKGRAKQRNTKKRH